MNNQQPYQRATEEIRRQGEAPRQFLRSAVTAGSAGLGANIASRVVPFLSKFIPDNLFSKGLSKVDRRLGKFVDNAEEAGYSKDEIREFIGEKVSKVLPKKESQPAQDKRNIIEQYSPELHQFISDQIKSGRKPMFVGAIAEKDERFASAIKKLKKDHKLPFGVIIQAVYGNGETAQPGQNQNAQPNQSQGNPQTDGELFAAFENLLKM